jgi:hypothetical protein
MAPSTPTKVQFLGPDQQPHNRTRAAHPACEHPTLASLGNHRPSSHFLWLLHPHLPRTTRIPITTIGTAANPYTPFLYDAGDLQFDAGMTLQPRLVSHETPSGAHHRFSSTTPLLWLKQPQLLPSPPSFSYAITCRGRSEFVIPSQPLRHQLRRSSNDSREPPDSRRRGGVVPCGTPQDQGGYPSDLREAC